MTLFRVLFFLTNFLIFLQLCKNKPFRQDIVNVFVPSVQRILKHNTVCFFIHFHCILFADSCMCVGAYAYVLIRVCVLQSMCTCLRDLRVRGHSLMPTFE